MNLGEARLKAGPMATMMTRDEFLAVYGFQRAAWWYPAYGAQDLEPEIREKFFEDLGMALRWAIKYLANRGARFQGLEIDARNNIVAKQSTPIEPRNELFLMKIAAGRMVSPVISIQKTLEFIDLQRLDVDKGPLTEVLIQCEKDKADAVRWWEEDQETVVEAEKVFDERMKLIGLERIGKGVH